MASWLPEQKPFWADLVDSAMANTRPPGSVGQAYGNQGTAALGCPACCGHLQAWSNLSAHLTGLF